MVLSDFPIRTQNCKYEVTWTDRYLIHWTILISLHLASSGLKGPMRENQNRLYSGGMTESDAKINCN